MRSNFLSGRWSAWSVWRRAVRTSPTPCRAGTVATSTTICTGSERRSTSPCASGAMFGVGDMHASMGDGEICGTGVEIAGEVTVRFDLLKGKQGAWPVSETEEAWIAHGTATEYPEAMREACREAAYLLAGEWGLSLEDAFILLSIRADVGVAQACKPSPFATIARVVVPKLDAIPGPFRV